MSERQQAEEKLRETEVRLDRALAAREQAEAKLRHANRTLQMISQCDRFLVRATEEVGLLRDICRILVEAGGCRLAWAGFAEADEARTVRPVAHAGFEEGYLETVNITWADTERGLGPAGTAIRTGQPCLIRNNLTDPNFTPWRAEALKRGYASCIGLPLVANNESFGVLMVYAAAPDAFDAAEVDLLIELADNLAYGITALRTRAERQRTEEALRVSNDNIANILNSISDAFFALDEHLVVTYFNPTAEKLLHRRGEEVLGRNLFEAFPQAKGSIFETNYTQAVREKKFLAFEAYFDREPYRDWYEVRVYPQRQGILVFFQVVTERKRAEAALQTSEARLRAIIETEPECVKMVASDGRLLEMNPAGLAMIEADRPDQVIGRVIYDLIAPEHRSAFRALTESVCLGQPGTLEFEMVGLKGVHRWMETHAVPFRRQAEGDTCLLGVTRDITQRKQAEAELTRHREHLEELVAVRTADLQAANSDLEAFSYSVSHDLRAPLRAIDGYAHILSEDYAQALGQEGQRVLDVISQQAARMSQLIDDLLAFARMGRQAMQMADVNMDALAQEAFREQSLLNPERAVEFNLSPLPPAHGDRAMLRVVLNNLLSNAMKYTRGRATPRIEIGSAAPGALNIYYVKDNGVGFDMQHAGKLFGVFQRLHSSEEFEGTGVGLALVQRIIRRQGGRVWAEAKPNEGATFFFSLPGQQSSA